MKTVGITGVDGLIGWHLSCFLHGISDVRVARADRETFEKKEALQAFVKPCDVIVHLAGMNRGNPQEVADTNLMLTRKLIAACENEHVSPHILFSSSTQVHRKSEYGDSKRRCTEQLEQWASNHNAPFTNLILPNIFGENGKPFYNSVVSTFCFQIANGQTPEIIEDNTTEQLHAQKLCDAVWKIIQKGKKGDISLKGRGISVSELLAKLNCLDALYKSQVIPDFRDSFELELFNTYRSYLFPDYYPISIELHSDNRGDLFEVVKTHGGGQSFLSTTYPGVKRGEHYHRFKFERFVIVKGTAEISVRRLFSDQVINFRMGGDQPYYVDIPTLHTHNLVNIGDEELITLFWAHEIFDVKKPDTYQEMVAHHENI